MSNLARFYIFPICVFLVLLMGSAVERAHAQPKPTPTAPKPELTPEELYKKAHEETLKAFTELKAANESKQNEQCKKHPDLSIDAEMKYQAALARFKEKADREARHSPNAEKAFKEWHDALAEREAALQNATIPKEYKEKTKEQAKAAYEKYLKVIAEEKAKIFREYESELKELGCPVESLTMLTGGYIGGELVKNWGRVRSTETLADTGVVTNQFKDSGDPLGIGIVAGYNFAPWNNNILIGPFASFDWLHQTINRTFAGGTFLGTTTHWMINLGAKGGVVVAPGLYAYGLAGAAWLRQDLNVNFATAASRTTTTPGFTLGLGGEYQPSSWNLFGNPVSVFLQYQHTWWDTANFNTPTSSPFFNYAFKRDDDTIKLGMNIHLWTLPPPAPTRGLITK